MRSRDLAIFFFSLGIFLGFVGGLYDSPISVVNKESDLKVDAEYINGILTASSILFGIWTIVMERKPEGREIIKSEHEHLIMSELFFIPFAFLVISVIFVSLTAVNLFSSQFTLLVCALGFATNAIFIAFALHFYKFKKQSERK